MSGIYIHIPFCKRKCYYCNFYSTTIPGDMNELVSAVGKEASLRKEYPGPDKISSLYFGGGTPSILDINALEFLLDKVRSNFHLTGDAEITLEANPDDIKPDYAKNLHSLGVNRISLGVQSFRDQDLKLLGRRHTAQQAIKSLEMIRNEGFSNISIDLIFGLNTLDNDSWEENINTFLLSDLPHLSAYALTVEPGTTLEKMIHINPRNAPDDERISSQFEILMDRMEEEGYTHYEISNYSREGWHSRHNSSYWKRIPYLGLGPSAHSYNGSSRQWNISDVKKYVREIQNNRIPCENEYLTAYDRYNEYIMTSLRTAWGVHEAEIEKIFGDDFTLLFKQTVRKQVGLRNVALSSEGSWILTRTGKLYADSVISDFFVPE